MHFTIYLLLGVLDIFALFALLFKAFRLPYVEYVREIGIIAVAVSLVSFVVRVYMETSGLLDIVLHFVMYILFFRYLIKIRYRWAITISFGYFGYGLISGLANYVFSQLTTSPTVIMYGTQVTQIVLAFSIAWFLYIRGLGFSFIIRPPHDVFVRKKMKKTEMLVINLGFLVAAISFVMAMLILKHENFIVIPFNLVVFGVLIYLGYRKDRTRE